MMQILILLWMLGFYQYYKNVRKSLFIWYFLYFTFILYTLEFLYPPLALDSSTDSTQWATLRILASYVYFGDTIVFWKLIAASIFAFYTYWSLILVNIKKFDDYEHSKSEFNQLLKKIIFMQALFYYFYWLFLKKYSPDYLAEIISNMWLAIVLHLLIIIASSFLFHGLLKLKLNNINKTLLLDTAPVLEPILFECPHCKAEYHSNVKYCVKCNKEI